MNIKLRKGNLNDLDFLFNLRNEEAVRKVSFSSEPIDLDVHRNWLKKKLASNDSVLMIAQEDSRPIAQIRFDWINDSETQINIAVTEAFRGRGYGSEIIKQSSAEFFREFIKCKSIHAFIKPDNPASIHSFRKAGYVFQVETEYHGQVCVEMILTR